MPTEQEAPRKQRVWGLTKDQMIDRNVKTADYQRELLRRHKACQVRHGATPSVLFDSDDRRYYVECDACVVNGGVN